MNWNNGIFEFVCLLLFAPEKHELESAISAVGAEDGIYAWEYIFTPLTSITAGVALTPRGDLDHPSRQTAKPICETNTKASFRVSSPMKTSSEVQMKIEQERSSYLNLY